MKKFLATVAVGALLAGGLFGVVTAQTISVPQVTSINPGTDLIQVIPGGYATAQSVYAPVWMVRGGTSSTTGIFPAQQKLIEFKNSDGTTLAASASAGKFGLSITAGTSMYLLSEAANSNTKTDVAGYEYVVPSSYIPGSNITVTVNCNYTLGSGTVGTHTLAAAAYLTTSAGVQGSTLIATAAQTVPATAGTVTFTITGGTLVAGSRLWLTFTGVIQDTGGSNITAQINSVTFS